MGNIARFSIAMVSGVALASASLAFTATNSVPDSRSGSSTTARTLAQLLPTECDGMAPTSLIIGTGTTIDGTSAANLMLGTSGVNALDGKGGNDCIIGGDGIDNLKGGGGIDVCISGPGVDTFASDCETQIQ